MNEIDNLPRPIQCEAQPYEATLATWGGQDMARPDHDAYPPVPVVAHRRCNWILDFFVNNS